MTDKRRRAILATIRRDVERYRRVVRGPQRQADAMPRLNDRSLIIRCGYAGTITALALVFGAAWISQPERNPFAATPPPDPIAPAGATAQPPADLPPSLTAQPTVVQPQPVGQAGVFRNRVVPGDPDRNTILIWSRAAAAGIGPQLNGPLTLTTMFDPPITLPDVAFPAAEPVPFAERAALVPLGTAVGDYRLVVAGVDCGAVTVEKSLTRPKLVRLPPGSTAQTIEAALERFDVELLPGTYYLTRAVHLPANRRITGYGAHLFRVPDGDYGERLFVGGEDCTLTGLTLHPWYLAFHGEATTYGLVLDHCTLASGILGYGYGDALVRGCTFAGGYAIYAPPGAYLGCRFEGGVPSSALMFSGSYPGNTCVVDCTFTATRDAMVVNTNNGSFTDNLIHGLKAFGIVGNANGNEVCSAEGNPANECSRNLYLFTTAVGCCSPIGIAETTVKDNFWWTITADGPSSIVIDGWGGAEVSGNVFANYELRGGRLVIGARDNGGNLVSGKIARNTFVGHHAGPLIPSRLNQPTGSLQTYGVTGAVFGYSAEELQANEVSGVQGTGKDEIKPEVWKQERD